MTIVVFRRDYHKDRVFFRRGQLARLEDAEAQRLVDMGVADIRPAHEPTETKEEA